MSMKKAIKHGKAKRRPYYKSKRFDRSCRCNGSCKQEAKAQAASDPAQMCRRLQPNGVWRCE